MIKHLKPPGVASINKSTTSVTGLLVLIIIAVVLSLPTFIIDNFFIDNLEDEIYLLGAVSIISLIVWIYGMTLCYLPPEAANRLRVHYLWGVTKDGWVTGEGEATFWIGKLLHGRFGCTYIARLPGPMAVQNIDLFVKDSPGMSVNYSGRLKDNGEADPAVEVEGIILPTLVFFVDDILTLLSQLVVDLRQPFIWEEGGKQELEKKMIRTFILPFIREICLHSFYRDMTTKTLQKRIKDRLNEQDEDRGEEDGRTTLDAILIRFGVKVESVVISKAKVTAEKVVAAMAAVALEQTQREQEELNITSYIAELKRTFDGLWELGFALHLRDENERRSAVMNKATEIIELNMELKTTRGEALAELFDNSSFFGGPGEKNDGKNSAGRGKQQRKRQQRGRRI